MNTKTLITIASGPSYQAIARITHPTHRAYAKRINADHIVISKSTYQNPSFQKLHLLSYLDHYNRIMFLDTDIIINENCPDIFKLVPEQEIGIYDEGLLANEQERKTHTAVLEKAAQLYSETLPERGAHFYNSGVWIASRCHRHIFDKPFQEIHIEYADQPLFNLRILNSNFRIFDIGYKFNRMPYVNNRVPEPRHECHIIHYAGLPNVIELAEQDIKEWRPKEQKALINPQNRQHMLEIIGVTGKKCVEIGVFEGRYSADILSHNPETLWLIDPWVHQNPTIYPDHLNVSDDEFEKHYYEVIEKFQNDLRVKIIRDFSFNAASNFENESLDFVYIDAIHTFEFCYSDILTWFPKVKSKGWICGHDYTGVHYAIKPAVNTFLKISGQQLALLTMESYASWGIQKS